MSISIAEISKTELASWNSGLAEPSLFLTAEWLAAFDKLKCVGLYDNTSSLVAGFCYFEGKLKGLSVLRTPPFTPHNGWQVKKPEGSVAVANSFYKRCSEVAAEFLDTLSAKHIVSLNLPPEASDAQSWVWKGFNTPSRYTYLLRLAESDFRSNYAKRLTHALKKVNEQQLIAKVESVSKDTVVYAQRKLGQAIPEVDLHYLTKIQEEFCKSDNSYMTVVNRHNEIQSFAWVVYNSNRAYYIAGGVISDSPQNSAGSLALDAAIDHAQQLGIKNFDFEGSMLSGVEQFFRSFGGVLTPYIQLNKASFWKEVLLKVKRRGSF